MLAIGIICLSYPADSSLTVRNSRRRSTTRDGPLSVRDVDRSEGNIEEGEKKREEGKEGREGRGAAACQLQPSPLPKALLPL